MTYDLYGTAVPPAPPPSHDFVVDWIISDDLYGSAALSPNFGAY